jgi:hypothetical protein
MNSQFSLSMNSPRIYEEKSIAIKDKDKDKEKEEKLKELTDKNERLEKECLKFQMKVKGLEDKLLKLKETEYKVRYNKIN